MTTTEKQDDCPSLLFCGSYTLKLTISRTFSEQDLTRAAIQHLFQALSLTEAEAV